MHLKGLEMQGFKSFPDKINVAFNNGITAIVGPNGSGKSNIADAVRWVMGEMSTKTLRGVKMEDVIFDGTQDRKSVGFAEVSLTIDNADHVLPLEYSDVTVTRRYFRSGESEYYINKAPVRLKDINELFMDTGLGRDGYSIIGQGRIAEILSVKSEDRRQIFEEAAGISKYRYRKEEAERKLAATEENLIRLRDIVAELEERIEPLKEQAANARQFLDLREEKKVLEVSVWLDGIEKIKNGMDTLEQNYNIAKQNLDNADRNLEELENEIDKTFNDTKEHTVTIDNIRNEIKLIEEDASGKDSFVAVLLNDISHNEEKVERIRTDIENDINRAGEIDAQTEGKRAAIAQLQEGVVSLEGELNNILTESEKANKIAGEFSEQIEKIRENITAATLGITDLKIKESSLISGIDGLKIRLTDIDTGDIGRLSELTSTREAKKVCADGITERENKQNALKNIISGHQLKMSTKEEKTVKNRQKRDSLNLKYNEKTQRIQMLSDMEKHFEGFGNSIRAVMDEAKRGGLKGIYGPVSSLIRVKDEFSLAVETALGGAIQNIVTETENDAKAAIYYLKSGNMGRATFLPLSSVKGGTLSDNDIAVKDGFIGIASSLLEYEKKYDGVIASLLGRTAVVEHIDNAIKLAQKTGYRFRIVTLDGQIVNAGGSLTGGSVVKNAGVLSRANEIERLKAELNKIKEELEATETELKTQEAELAQAKAYLEGANAEFRVLEDELIKERTTLSHFDVLIEGLERTKQDAQNEKASINAQLKSMGDELKAVNKGIEEAELKERAAQEELSLITGSHGDIAAERERLSQTVNDKKMEIISVKKDIEAAHEAIKELENQKAVQFLSKDKKESEINDINTEITNIKSQIETLTGEAKTLRNSAVGKKADIEKLITERENAEQRITELRSREKEKIEHKNKYVAEVERLEGKKANVQIEYDAIIMKLWDEYELTFTEAQKLKTELESIAKVNRRINEIKSAVRALGDVNVGAIEEYKQVKERYEFLTVQVDDLIRAKTDLEKIVADLTDQMRNIFSEQFKVINMHFNNTFRELFEGGSAGLVLNDPSDVLSSGIEINVVPPGKIIKHLSMLSAGEQAFVAIALYFAILKVRPTPFCILDEIETALDDVNVVRFAEYLRRLTKDTQFIAITHRRGTMEEADTLYGVTMQEKGVSKLLTINVNEIEERLKIS